MEWPFVRRFKLDAVLTVNQVYLDEINRLNQELAGELNSHRETKKKSRQRLDAYDCLFKELEETKDALKIAQEDNVKIKKLNDKWWKAIKRFVLEINVSKTDDW